MDSRESAPRRIPECHGSAPNYDRHLKSRLIYGMYIASVVALMRFANSAIGGVAVASLFFRDWEFPIALVGTIFYALAGINHVTDKRRNKLQSFAMVSDLFAAAVLLMSCLAL
jgi:hypothetical protein